MSGNAEIGMRSDEESLAKRRKPLPYAARENIELAEAEVRKVMDDLDEIHDVTSNPDIKNMAHKATRQCFNAIREMHIVLYGGNNE